MSPASKRMSPGAAEEIPTLSPADAGRRMTLAEFGPALAAEGYRFELDRGVVVVDVPKYQHEQVLSRIRSRIYRFDDEHPGRIALIAASNGCKLVIPGV